RCGRAGRVPRERVHRPAPGRRLEGGRVTGVPGTVGHTDWTLPRAPGRPKTERQRTRLESFAVPPLALRALAFFAFAIFAGAPWTALVDPAPARRAFVVAIVATAA